MTLQDILDPQIDASFKGYPQHAAPLRRSGIAAQHWNVLDGDLPLPIALVKRDAVTHNLAWMQRFACERGVDMAPHGKTTMSPQLFRRQLDAGAWGLTFATVGQVRAGATAGARRCIIANQVLTAADLQGIQTLQQEFAGLRIAFLVDSLTQVGLIEAWFTAQTPGSRAMPFEVLVEIGVPGGRTGCRTHADALALAERVFQSAAVRLIGIECYEGGGASGNTEPDSAYANALMERVNAIALACDAAGWFDTDEVLITAGGSAIFDLVVNQLKPALSRPVRGLLRSGCYVTHDHGHYRRLVNAVNTRLDCADGLHPAIEVWATVQSCPEPGLAILAVGRRDLSYDIELPKPIAYAPAGARAVVSAPADWSVTALNDQHAYLRWTEAGSAVLTVGDRVGLGISHPCTTFDKWRWMPVVDAHYNVCDALVTCF